MSTSKLEHSAAQIVTYRSAASTTTLCLGIVAPAPQDAGTTPQDIIAAEDVADGDNRSSDDDEWDAIANDSLTSAELDEVAAYLKKTGQASM